ncbi:TetR/AcrR family transcriptional regulator [Bradyrhizobium sp. Arg62]|uniref:TetR/AcrR family transcriptional regulator n=1 Tax=Bradyrhizobium brasilense TaxID=1419277 RepID=UPI001E3884A7|nr:TetR/AcrR family transcriptional regulator [Bradyrhizobium brasilense]MCC8943934.1 TetR/AcrR family transcriptional regulator [Bradyrhizobium brasilense]
MGQGTRRSEDRQHGRHKEILDGLEEIFLTEGFQTPTVADLCARLHCSKRSLYEIAPTKPELFLLILRRVLDRIRRLGMRGALEKEDPQARILAYLQPGITESSRATQRFNEDLRAFESARLMLEEHQKERVAVLRDIIEDGIKKGHFRTLHAHLAAEIYLAAARLTNQPEVLAAAGLTMSEAFAELPDLLFHGLFKRNDDAPRRAGSKSR